MFRFTIRDVLWLTVVVAVGLAAWSFERTAASRRIAEIEAREAKLRTTVAEVHEREKKVQAFINSLKRQLPVSAGNP